MVLFAFSIASSGVRKVSTLSTGPKISSRAMRWLCDTSVKSVGLEPVAALRQLAAGAEASRALGLALATSSRILSSCIFELMAPTSVFLSSGSPRAASHARLELGDDGVVRRPLARAGASPRSTRGPG
jgi:hypothetical protein